MDKIAIASTHNLIFQKCAAVCRQIATFCHQLSNLYDAADNSSDRNEDQFWVWLRKVTTIKSLMKFDDR